MLALEVKEAVRKSGQPRKGHLINEKKGESQGYWGICGQLTSAKSFITGRETTVIRAMSRRRNSNGESGVMGRPNNPAVFH